MARNLSFITPFHFEQSGRGNLKNAIQRLRTCIQSVCLNSNVEILIPANCDLSLLKRANIRLIEDNQFNSAYSPGFARDQAIKASQAQSIFLMDADLICSPFLNEHLHKCSYNQNQCTNSFEMYPCLYLTKQETERFDGDFQGCLESFLRGENHRVEGIALASSCLLLNREWFLQLGGFDERFVGHGGEDLELIDRLCQHYPIGPRPADYGRNIKAQYPGDYQGFRRYFSYYALPHLFAGRFLVHQWHPRPLTHPYHKRRAGNDALLEQMLANPGPLKGPVIPCNDLNGELPDFREWMIRLQEEAGYPISEYPGLLCWKDGVTVKRPLWRKMRKLYLNPKAFFKDMVKTKS
ncbi:MAG: galactosyltransferase-related protein [Leclercia adecarboxylata]|uniref:galactosyltransferase-related protein n=1 Tax=Empedobacter sp. UBA5987 TaxID=1946444 RepID=UPI0025C4265A|nr:galactosyltransferase-related protein [Empedobacter sp. UBA5987]MDU1088396.1 galactosyltransferase-related protein [Leclercia adecarboxylata]